jgi:hypothetical protein
MKIGKPITLKINDLIYVPVSSDVSFIIVDSVWIYVNDKVWSNLNDLIYWTIYNPIAILIRYNNYGDR